MRTNARLVLAFALAVAPSCASDHSALGLRPHAGGAAGASGQGGASGLGGRGGALTRPPVAGATGANPGKHVDVPGRSVLTLVHGIVDAQQTAWCFARVRDGKTTLVGDPLPQGGLAYGESMSFESLSGVKAETDGVVPFVIAGDLAELDGLDCAAAVARAQAVMDAANAASTGGRSGAAGQAGEGGAAGEAGLGGEGGGHAQSGTSGAAGEAGFGGVGGEASLPTPEPPALRVGSLPGLPAGTLAQGYSVLEVADGCLGAPAFTDRYQRLACGFDYTPEHGSLSAELVILARDTMDGRVALQALHASRGSDGIGVRSAPGALDDGVAMTVVDNFVEGTLRPRDPNLTLPVTSWGANMKTWTIDGTINGTPYSSSIWSVVRKRARIDMLENGRGYTLIALGPAVDIGARGFWNTFTFALVDNDPPVD